jgi:Zn-dependent peptidase ImmA (M78 family)
MHPNLAEQYLRHFWNGQLPVDVRNIAERCGILVQDNPVLGCSGQIAVNSSNRVVIDVNSTESQVRQRFTVAHELGHWALSHLANTGVCFRDDARSFAMAYHDPREVAANQFAADLLMPAAGVEWALRSYPGTSIQNLANIFKVSGAAMEFRLKNLGLLNV